MRVNPATPVLMLIPGTAGGGDVLAASDRISLTKARADALAAVAEVAGPVEEARVRVEAARVKLERVDALQKEKAGSIRSRDEALAEYQLAQAELATARNRQTAFENVLAELRAEA